MQASFVRAGAICIEVTSALAAAKGVYPGFPWFRQA